MSKLHQLILLSTPHDQESPALPATFEYGDFKYIDTARVEPKVAYTPTNTPPKTPQTPHFDLKPFKQPNYIDGVWIMPGDQEPYTGQFDSDRLYRLLQFI